MRQAILIAQPANPDANTDGKYLFRNQMMSSIVNERLFSLMKMRNSRTNAIHCFLMAFEATLMPMNVTEAASAALNGRGWRI